MAEVLGYRSFLLDGETGLYNHFWLEKLGRSYTQGWGRGQGWALLGLIDVAGFLPGGMAGAADVRAEALRLARRMLDYQLPDGNWHCKAMSRVPAPKALLPPSWRRPSFAA